MEAVIAGLYVKLRKLRVKMREASRRGDSFAVSGYQNRIEDVKAQLRAEQATAEARDEEEVAA
jgi:hypothetical protein